MKIAVLGTSNSVMGMNGFAKALSLRHQITNRSIGRAPIYSHITSLLEHWEDYESHDLLIIDHYVNDANFYAKALGPEYRKYREQFYDLLATINTRVLSVIFPIQDFDSAPKYKDVRDFGCGIADKHNITHIDLNDIGFEAHHFSNRLHLTHDVSYMFGMHLLHALEASDLGEKPSGGSSENVPFRAVRFAEPMWGMEAEIFSNRLLSAEYVNLDRQLLVTAASSSRLLSVSYLRLMEDDHASGMRINGTDFGFAGTGYFVEAVDAPVHGSFTLEPIPISSSECRNMMGRGRSAGPFGPCRIAGFLLHDRDTKPSWSPARRNKFKIDMSGFIESVNRMCPDRMLSHTTVNLLRDAALRIEADDVNSAYEIMRIAHAARPDGPLIKEKLEEYAEALAEKL